MLFNNSCSKVRYVPLTIQKLDSQTGLGIAGAVFELKGCNDLICRGTTDSSGLLEFCVVPCNTYQLREGEPPIGYFPNNQVFDICVDGCGCIFVDGIPTTEIKIENTAVTASFTAIKVNLENGDPLAGALYSLLSGGVPIRSTVSTEMGEVTFSDLPPGMYELSETSPPPGFQSNTDRLPVTVTPDGNVTILGEPANGFRLTNVPVMLLIFQKLDAQTLQPLAGAVFQLRRNSTVVASVTSDSNGNVNFGLLAPGTYELTEITAPSGFLPNEHVYQVIISTDGSITVDGVALDNFRVGDVKFPGFSFIKTSNVTGLPLAGATFELRKNGTVIGTSTSDLTGFVSFSSLPLGLYQLSEISPPVGYMSHPTIHQVLVSSNGTVTIDGLPYQEFSITNIRISIEFNIRKIDINGNPLSGAVYELRSNGTTIQTQTSDSNGLMTFSDITTGAYTLLETISPAGFILNTSIHTVVVSLDGMIFINDVPTNHLTVMNESIPPVTGPNLLGWMRSSETPGFVPGARIPNIPPADGVFNGWEFLWTRSHTLMQYFENETILAAAISGEYTQEALEIPETLFPTLNPTIDETFVWDGGSGHQFFTGYFNAPVIGGWASWANVNVPDTLLSPQTKSPIPGGYTPYHYSLRRFTAYLDVDFSSYTVDSAFLVSQFPSDVAGEFIFPLNDSIFVFVNGTLAYWTSTDLIGSGNVAQNRLFFEDLEATFMTKEYADSAPPPDARFVFTDGWYLTLGGSFRIADIAPFLRDGKNVIDVIADDYYFGGGMSRINTEFLITPRISL